ncbi:ribosome modulation factor [Methylobacterium sp. P5_C11]
MTDVQAIASDSPFFRGRNARLYAKPVSECVYPDGSNECAAWMVASDPRETP